MFVKLLRIMAFFLALPLILASCNNGGADVAGSDENTSAQTAPQQINLTEYRIIRPEKADGIVVEAAKLLRKTVSDAIAAELEIATDWTANGAEPDADAKEILIGNTNRSQSAEAAEGLTLKDYAIVFSGSKIVIAGGSPNATYSAVEYFLKNYISYENGAAVLKNTGSYIMKYEYKYDESEIKVASLNLLTASNAQVNQQAEREPRIVKFVENYQPYSIGVQECEIFWRMRLDKVLTGYERAQEVTTVTKNYIYYRTDKLKVIDSGVFWLSETPDVSSQGFGSKYYISCCWAVFESLENGSRYVHMNTHLDVNSAAIRESELTVLLPRVKNFIDEGYAVVLTGDFNSEEETAVYKTITSSGLADSKYQTTNASRIPTYNGFADDVSKYEGPIDYCFVNSEIKVTLYRVIDKQDGGFLSDHNAIYSEMTIYPR